MLIEVNFQWTLVITFYNHYAAGFVCAVHISGDTAIFARIFRLAVDNFQGNHTIRMGNGIITLR